MSDARRYGPDYHEDVELRDGTLLELRLVRPDDKESIQAGLMRLSPQSQYFRFFTAKPRLTAAELAYFTEVDGEDHFAIAAGFKDAKSPEEHGVGIGRFVRLPDEPEVAEPAVAVIDDMQHRGIGRLLMKRLMEAALERGVTRFRSEFLAVNEPARELMASLSPHAQFESQGSVVVVEFPLVSPDDTSGEEIDMLFATPMHDWMRLVASRMVEIRRSFGIWFDPQHLRETWRSIRGELGLGADGPADASNAGSHRPDAAPDSPAGGAAHAVGEGRA